MQVQQNLAILLYLKRKKASHDGRIPIYVRITIDGLQEELSSGCKVLTAHWDAEHKQVSSGDRKWKTINSKLSKLKTDLERHFYLVQAKVGLATAELVKASYQTPVSGQQQNREKLENAAFSADLDTLIDRYLKYCEKVKKSQADGRIPGTEKQILLNLEKEGLQEEVKQFTERAHTLLDKKDRQKTFFLIVNDFLLNYLQLALTGHRSTNTLEKWMGRKRRYQDFLQYRYRLQDMPLHQIKYPFIEEVFQYLLVQHQVIENTAMKYAQCVKEMMDRAVAKGWVPANVFVIFKCQYTDPDHDWLSMQELEILRNTTFEKEKLNVIRDIFIFSSFTGLAYQELRTLRSEDIITGIDGKQWISKSRQKTDGDETLPLLPLPLAILAKYKENPICLRRRVLLPVPTNEEYNRCLKEIGKETNFRIVLRTHKSRYFFANEVTYNAGVPLKTVSKMLGHKSVKTTEVYVRANKTAISESMEQVEAKLFDKEGNLKSQSNLPKPKNALDGSQGKLIQMPSNR